MNCRFCSQPLQYVHGHGACLNSQCPLKHQNQAPCCEGECNAPRSPMIKRETFKDCDIISRPSGGPRIVLGLCSDGEGHAFRLDGDKIQIKPLCGKDVQPRGRCSDDTIVCETCAGGAESWAMGGSLKILRD